MTNDGCLSVPANGFRVVGDRDHRDRSIFLLDISVLKYSWLLLTPALFRLGTRALAIPNILADTNTRNAYPVRS